MTLPQIIKLLKKICVGKKKFTIVYNVMGDNAHACFPNRTFFSKLYFDSSFIESSIYAIFPMVLVLNSISFSRWDCWWTEFSWDIALSLVSDSRKFYIPVFFPDCLSIFLKLQISGTMLALVSVSVIPKFAISLQLPKNLFPNIKKRIICWFFIPFSKII